MHMYALREVKMHHHMQLAHRVLDADSLWHQRQLMHRAGVGTLHSCKLL